LIPILGITKYPKYKPTQKMTMELKYLDLGKLFIAFILFFLMLPNLVLCQSNMLYSGGYMYHKVDEYTDVIKSSGFNTIVIWSVHIGDTGNLILNEALIVEDGEYVGREEWPEELNRILVPPTSVNRLELSVGSAGVPDWEMIEKLIDEEGTGPTSSLYKNFAKIKELLPIVAINNDDESNYDVASTVAFSKMLIDLGFDITFAPYTFQSFWSNVYNQLEDYSPGSVDKIYVQAYAGGTGNTPSAWNGAFDIQVTPGLWGCTVQSPEQLENQFSGWSNTADGGFLWIFEDLLNCNPSSITEYADAINNAFDIPPPELEKASSPFPANGETGISVDADLTWTGGSFDAVHKLYFSPSPILTEANFQGDQTTSTFDPGTLERNRTYYWRVDETNETGTVTGDTWSYTTEITTSGPSQNTEPLPADASKGIRKDVKLSWNAGDNAVSHDIYFGTENPPPFVANQTQTSFTPNDIEPLTTYYWQVNSVNSESTTTGDIWSFTSIEPNLAPDAAIAVSSEFNNTYSKERLVDGIIGINGNGEWASLGEQTPTARLTWNNQVTIKKIVLYDRPNGIEKIFSGILEFSDGSSIDVGELPDTGSAFEVEVDDKVATYVEFRPTNAVGPNVGLAEFEVFGLNGVVSSSADDLSISDTGNVFVFPNPSNGLFTIKLPESDANVEFGIYSTTGNLIYKSGTVPVNDNKIQVNLAEVTQGLKGGYFLHLTQANYSSVRKIVLE